jgi:hypothetical protein
MVRVPFGAPFKIETPKPAIVPVTPRRPDYEQKYLLYFGQPDLRESFRYWLRKQGRAGSLVRLDQGDDNLIVELRRTKKGYVVNSYIHQGVGRFRQVKGFQYSLKRFGEAQRQYNKLLEEF